MLQAWCECLGHTYGQPERGDVAERVVTHPAHVDVDDPAVGDRRARGVDVGRDLQGTREVVRRAERDDPERDAAMCESVDPGAQCAVAAADDHEVTTRGEHRVEDIAESGGIAYRI